MANSKFKIQPNQLAFMRTTGEPVYVLSLSQPGDGVNEVHATIVRPVVTPNGIEHNQENVLAALLQTRFKKACEDLVFEQFVESLRDEVERKRYALPAKMQQALTQAINPSQRTLFEGVDNA